MGDEILSRERTIRKILDLLKLLQDGIEISRLLHGFQHLDRLLTGADFD